MAKDWAKNLYNSKQWQDLRNSYYNSINGLCERCLKNGKINPAEIIHHKEYVTVDNINDTNITLNRDNLEGLCRECHKKEHDGNLQSIEEGLIFDENGDVVYDTQDIS